MSIVNLSMVRKLVSPCFSITFQLRTLAPANRALQTGHTCLLTQYAATTAATASTAAGCKIHLQSHRCLATESSGRGQQQQQQQQQVSNIVSIQDEADYDKRVRNSKQAVVLQFHATWCAPCKLLKPRLEKAVRSRPKLLLAAVDVDNLPDLAAEYRVVSVPMVLALKDGRVVDSFVGLKEWEAVQDFVDKFAEKNAL